MGQTKFIYTDTQCGLGGKMKDQQQAVPQPITALAQMLGEMALMSRDRVVVNQCYLEAFHVQSERQTRVLKGLPGQVPRRAHRHPLH